MTKFDPLIRALESLKEALDPPPANDRERDGAIQRFEYTFELAWKIAKRVLEEQGIQSLNPKSVIRDLAQQGWIDNADKWLGYLKARNETSHTYNETIAQRVFEEAKRFAPDCQKLLNHLKVL